jgi:hypothetical protein
MTVRTMKALLAEESARSFPSRVIRPSLVCPVSQKSTLRAVAFRTWPEMQLHVTPCAEMALGGTGAVAPLWAGLIALINQSMSRALGFTNPTLYHIGASAFRDIVSGNNGHYSAGAGWDACTGLGTPNGTAPINALRTSGMQVERG